MGSAFSINLDGAQVVGGVTTSAFGTGFAVYDETAVTLTYEIRIFGLDFGDLFDGGVEETADAGDDVTTAHIHIGNIGSSGGVAFAFLNDNDLTQVENADGSRTIRGVWDESDGQPITPYSTTFANAGPGDDMGLYFNIHTASFGGGEIRGQIIGNADELGNTVTGTSGPDTLVGLGGDDLLLGSGGNDSLLGGDGGDFLDGGSGDDTSHGGDGDDTHRVDDATDVVIEDPDEGRDTVYSYLDSFTLGDNFEDLALYGATSHTGIGNELDNVIYGDRPQNAGVAKTLSGLGGNDTLNGGDANDTLLGGEGNDRLDGNLGDDSLVGGLGNDIYELDSAADVVVEAADEGQDRIDAGFSIDLSNYANVENAGLTGSDNLNVIGTSEANVIFGNSGDNRLEGLDGDDVILGGQGADTLLGGAGADLMDGGFSSAQVDADSLDGGSGSDTLRGFGGNDTLLGDADNDDLRGGTGDDSLLGGTGNDTITGEEDNDTLLGDAGDDLLLGGDGDDLLSGGADNDTLNGGAGTDTASYDFASTGFFTTFVGTDHVRIESADGTDQIQNTVERIAFTDTTLDYADLASRTLETTSFQFDIDSGQTVAGVTSSASGNGFAVFDPAAMTWRYEFTVSGLDFGGLFDGGVAETADTSDDVTTMHFHSGARGSNGGVAFAFLNDADLTNVENADGSRTISGIWDRSDSPSVADYAGLFGSTPPGQDVPLYLNVHTSGNPSGEIRGQIVSAGTDEANTITGSDGANRLLGLGGDDTLNGGDGGDVLDGGAGADDMTGGPGNDSYYMRAGEIEGDFIDDREGVNTLLASPGFAQTDLRFVREPGVAGDAGNLAIYFGSEKVVLNDFFTTLLTPTGQADGVQNNGYFDRILFDEGFESRLSSDLMYKGTDNAESLLADLDNNRLFGFAGDDFLSGGRGNDVLDGGAGADRMAGGSGNDSYYLSPGEIDGDFIDDREGVNTLLAGSGLTPADLRFVREPGIAGDAGNLAIYFGSEKLELNDFYTTLLTPTGQADGVQNNGYFDRIVFYVNDETVVVGLDADLTYTGTDSANSLLADTDANRLIGLDGDDSLSGDGGDDTLDGGAGADSLQGGDGNDTLIGGSGDDTLRGGDGEDLAVFDVASTSIMTDVSFGRLYVASAEGRDEVGTDVELIQFTDRTLTFDQLSALISGTDESQTIQGTSEGEQINGLGGFDWIIPGRGDDTVDGGADRDMVAYSDVPAVPGRGTSFMLDLDLGAGRAELFSGEVDLLSSIERATGTIFADVMRGADGDDELRGIGDYDWFIATPGNDTLNGGNGLDMITFLEAQSSGAPVVQDIFATDGVPPTGAAVGGVLLDLADGSNNTGLAEGLTLISVERVTGSSHQDVFFGDGEQNDFRGLGGFDWFVSSTGGRERYFGGDGVDTVTYFNAASGVAASLRNGAVEFGGQESGYGSAGDAIRDLYFEIENLVGSDFDDRLEGNRERNDLVGRDGDDYLLGYGNIDYLKGGLGNDTLDGGAGSDFALFDGNRGDYTLTRTSSTEVTIVGADGTDSLINVEYFQFDDQTANIWELSIV